MEIVNIIDRTGIVSTYPVMSQLRPEYTQEQYISKMGSLLDHGYRLVSLAEDGCCLGCCGFREKDNLFYGRFIYIEDLVVDRGLQGKGYGRLLIASVEKSASSIGLNKIVLDSGLQRAGAHMFYEKLGFEKKSYHFAKVTES